MNTTELPSGPVERIVSLHIGGPDVERQEANTRLIAAAPDLLRLLGLMFDAYENGVDCFDEDPEDCAGYVGKAFRLPDREFKEIADLLNQLEDAKTLGVPANV